MVCNPDTYNKFKTERFAPFYDCLKLIIIRSGLKVIDPGCCTGELTGKLAGALPESKVLGIDSSQEMLNNSKAFAGRTIIFKHTLRLSGFYHLLSVIFESYKQAYGYNFN